MLTICTSELKHTCWSFFLAQSWNTYVDKRSTVQISWENKHKNQDWTRRQVLSMSLTPKFFRKILPQQVPTSRPQVSARFLQGAAVGRISLISGMQRFTRGAHAKPSERKKVVSNLFPELLSYLPQHCPDWHDWATVLQASGASVGIPRIHANAAFKIKKMMKRTFILLTYWRAL